MKNLKKILALVLAFACAFTMFAGAAFTDQADFAVDTDVVDTLVSLGVINGYTDGSFKPNDTVTRAEMAKMIYVLRTGNSDASAYNNDSTTFTDINGHWAAGYVKYCQSLGIIAGQSATKFAPDQTVTAQEAAKMLLVTLGYDPNKAGLVGATWAAKTNALADENGLLEDVNTSFTGPCPRQYAAQLIYNAIDAPTVVWRDDAYTTNNYGNGDNPTIGEKYMSLKKTVGTLASVTKQDGKDTYDLSIDGDSVNEDDSSDKYLTAFTKVEKDYSDMKYQTVKVLYKAKDKVYGVFATDDNTVQTGVLKDLKMDSGKAKLDGTKYDLTTGTQYVYVNGNVYAKGSDVISKFISTYGDVDSNDWKAPYLKGSKVELSAVDGTTKYSVLKVTTYEIGKVSYVGSDYINVTTKVKGTDASVSVKRSDDDYNYPSDLKKDDYVVITSEGNYADGKGVIEKATTVEGKVESTKGSNKVQINDEWYTMAGTDDNIKTPGLNSRAMLIVVNGYAYYTDNATVSTDDIALLVETGKKNGIGSKMEARLIFADGSDKTVEIEKYWDDKSANGAVSQEITDYPQLVTFDVSKDVYTLSKINEQDTAGYDVYASSHAANLKVDGSVQGDITASDVSMSKLYFESTGVVFVRYDAGTDNDDPSFKVVTGKTASNYDKNITYVQAVANKSNQNYYAQIAVLDFGSGKTGGASDDNYLVALDDSYTSKIDGTTYTMVKAWNGTEAKLYKSEDSKKLKAGDIFQYSNDSDDTISIDTLTQTYAYVKNYDESTGDITLVDQYKKEIESTTDVSYDNVDSKDTIVFYVNSDDGEGVTSGEIRLADIYDGGSDDHVNVNVYSEDDDQITIIVVDVNNDYTQW